MITCPACRADNIPTAKFCSECGTKLVQAGQTQRARKQVTVLFTDVVDSTSLGRRLDIEPLARVLERFFEVASEVLEANQGAVQKYVGDAVMAVFGLPQVQEDDALRAVRAAVELHAEVRALNAELLRDWGVELRVHTAISTGGVVVEEGETRELGVAADHINLVASLIKKADADVILIDRTTHHFVRGMVRAEPVHLPTLGDSGPVFSVLGLSQQPALPRRIVVPMIGRDWELGYLRMTYEGVLRRRSGYLVSVLGPPGIGKTRLVEEFSRGLARRHSPQERPQVLRGVCVRPLPASTFHPLRQVLRQAAGIRADVPREEARRQLERWAGGDEPVVARLAAFLELSGQAAEPEDTIRAICRALAIAARREPLVVVIDDLHWAEQPMLDALLQLKESLSDVRVLLVAVSREVFFDEARDWAGWARNTASLTLEPLGEPETEQMIGQILLGGEPDPEIVRAIVRETGGTPLDVEALMANLLEDGVLRLVDGRWVLSKDLSVLPTLLRGDAAFAARIERLNHTERRVIVRGALIGMQFRAAELIALASDLDPATVTTTLRWLVRRDLLKLPPETAGTLEGGESYTFSHARYQQAAYDRLTLEDRMVLHEQYANWLAGSRDDSPTTAERVAFHLRQCLDAHVALRGEAAERALELAERAGEWFARAGRGYITEATSPVAPVKRVLERAVRLLPEGSPEQLRARLDLADTLQEPDPLRARDIYVEVVEAARAIGERQLQRHAELGRLELRWYFESEGDINQDRTWLEGAIREFETLGDATGDKAAFHLAAKAYRLQSQAYAAVGKTTLSVQAADRALELIKRTGDARMHAKIVSMRCVNAFWGPSPLEEVVPQVQEAVRWARREGLFSLEALGLGLQARATAMRGDFERARQYSYDAKQVARSRADLATSAAMAISDGMVELLAGNLEDAERVVRAGYETEVARGAAHPTATAAALLARILLLSGRDAEAEAAIVECRTRAMQSQLDNQIKLRQLQAVLLARRDELAAAEKLAREAVGLSGNTEQPLSKAEALADLADILRQVGKATEARRSAEQALRFYRGKGHMVAARETERLLDRIGLPAASA